MNSLGASFKLFGWAAIVLGGLWGFVLCLAIISKFVGFWGAVAAIVIGPITVLAGPVYAGFEWHNWFPLALNYGGGLAGMVFVGIGSWLSGD